MLSRMSTVVVTVVWAVLALAGGAAPLPLSSSLLAATAPLSSPAVVRWPNNVAGGLIPIRTRPSVGRRVTAPGRRFDRAMTCQAASLALPSLHTAANWLAGTSQAALPSLHTAANWLAMTSQTASATLPSLHTAANWLGYGAVASGVVTTFPQYYENWKQKRGDSLSMDTILLGNAASLMNVSATWLCPMSAFCRVMALYIALNAALLAAQSLYYNSCKYPDPASKLSKLAIATAAIVTLTPLAVLGAGPQFGIGQANLVAANISLWMSNLLFVCARLPQLRMSLRYRNVRGVSIWMYALLIANNLLFGTGVLAQNIAARVPWSALSYGSLAATFYGPAVLDSLYLCLFWIYRPRDVVPKMRLRARKPRKPDNK